MISRVEHLRMRAADILDERQERAVIAIGETVPDVTMKTFQGEELSIGGLVSEEPLLLTFMRASW